MNDQFNNDVPPAYWNRYNGPYGSYNPGSSAIPSDETVAGGSLQKVMSYETDSEADGDPGVYGREPLKSEAASVISGPGWS